MTAGKQTIYPALGHPILTRNGRYIELSVTTATGTNHEVTTLRMHESHAVELLLALEEELS